MVKKKLKKDLRKMGDCDLIANKGDDVNTSRSDSGDLWVKVGDVQMIIWQWEEKDYFEQ